MRKNKQLSPRETLLIINHLIGAERLLGIMRAARDEHGSKLFNIPMENITFAKIEVKQTSARPWEYSILFLVEIKYMLPKRFWFQMGLDYKRLNSIDSITEFKPIVLERMADGKYKFLDRIK